MFVTGGASSGKSACAERACTVLGGRLVYLATMQPFGEEGARRVARHRAQRLGKGFDTVECYGDLAQPARDGLVDGATVLLECLGNAVANAMFGERRADGAAVAQGVAALALRARNLVVVGNEVGSDGAAYAAETRAYQEELGRAACIVAAASDVVVECVAGVPCVVKGTGALPAALVAALVGQTVREEAFA